jgi:uncharacterized protein YaaN involved in tellurite resistance
MFSKFLLFLFLENKSKLFKDYKKYNKNKFKINNIHSNILLYK